MKCAVIYFSLTGNTEKIARAIQIGVKQAAGHCDIYPIKEANPKRLYEYDLLGFGSPTMGQRVTTNVKLFINNLMFVGGKHLFVFCTHCTGWEFFVPSIVPMFKKRGLNVIGWDDWYGSSFGNLRENTPYWTDGHPDEIDLQEAETFGREMVWRSQRIYAGETGLIPEDPPIPPPRVSPFLKFIPVTVPESDEEHAKRADFKLNYYKEKCAYPKCRLCMDNCPMDGIDLTVNPPIVGKPCMTCMMCDQLCPTGAIEVDKKCLTKERPGIHEAFLDKVERVKELEKQGFRRLIPEEKVGYIDGETEVHRTYNKHPRFVIGKGRPYGVDPWSWRLKSGGEDNS